MPTLINTMIVVVGLASPWLTQARQSSPTFSQFPVVENFNGHAAPLRLRGPRDHEFRTALAAAAKRPVNFAGHYIVVEIGCGASCVLAAAIDAKSGTVAWLPFSLCCWDLDIPQPISFRIDSDLLVLNGLRNEAGQGGFHFYRFVHQRFEALHH